MENRDGNLRHGWVLFGGCLLAALAAAVNMDFMVRLGVSVSHLTGDYSRITLEAVRGGSLWSAAAGTLAVSVAGFVGGASLAGLFIHHPVIDVARPYGRSLIAIGGLLLLAHATSEDHSAYACGLAACACGFQNGLATRFRGLVLRTTHITGLLTDFGQTLGMRIRGHHVEGWKLFAPFVLALSFALGSALGAFARIGLDQPVLVWCGTTYILGGALWSGIKRRTVGTSSTPE